MELTTGIPDLRGEYTVLKRWYRQTSAISPNPLQADMSKVAEDYAPLYRWEEPTPPGRPVPTRIRTFGVNEDSPFEEGVELLVQQI